MKTVMVAGKFDPLHEGHIDHICKAAKLGKLLVITHTDEVIKKLKGRCNIPLYAREIILHGVLLHFNIRGRVRISVDKDGTITETLRKYKPDILAKGGDRTANNMPQNELDVCKELGIEIKYGIGDQLNASSKMEIKEK